MKTLKYSRQRESIKEFLMGRTDHPTADAVYMSIREQFPNISLGTVYRNLNLLVELGEIQKVSCGDGADHFDADTRDHYHFLCTDCGSVYDIPMETVEDINSLASSHFPGSIQGHITYFYGRCQNCLEKMEKKA